MIYVNAFVLFIQLVSSGTYCPKLTTTVWQVMASSGLQDYHPAADNPHTWMKFVGKISFLFGFWALFVFFKVFIYILRCIHSVLGNMTSDRAHLSAAGWIKVYWEIHIDEILLCHLLDTRNNC